MREPKQLIYLVLVLGSGSILLAYGCPAIEKSKYISSYHQYLIHVLLLMCMASWHKACNVGPGNITARTIPLYDHYEYDNILYTNKLCGTLHIRKIARSKYDRFSRRHIPRFDHFCGWLNQAVGERNYRWFLLFLCIHVFMCAYGTWAMASVMYGEIAENLLHAIFFDAVIAGAEAEVEICGVLLLMSVVAVCLGAFLCFHVYITSQNMTTNEFFKWRSVKRWHKQERKKYEQALKDGKVRTKINADSISKQVPDGDVGCVGPVEGEIASPSIEDDDIFDPGKYRVALVGLVQSE